MSPEFGAEVPSDPVFWPALRQLVLHYPVSLDPKQPCRASLVKLIAPGYAKQDDGGRLIPTAAAIMRYNANPRPNDTGWKRKKA